MAVDVTVAVGPDPILPDALLPPTGRSDCGALATFLGTVRGVTGERMTTHLEYEAYDAMATRTIRQIAERAGERFDLRAVDVRHRTGRVEVGETSLAVLVASPHRRDAFAACAFVVDEIKREAPVWKKEHGPDGELWVES